MFEIQTAKTRLSSGVPGVWYFLDLPAGVHGKLARIRALQSLTEDSTDAERTAAYGGGPPYVTDQDDHAPSVEACASYLSLLEEQRREWPKALIRPMTVAQFQAARSRSTVLTSAFRVEAQGRGGKANVKVTRDPLAAESMFAREVVLANVDAVDNIVGVDGDTGGRTMIKTAKELLKLIDNSSHPDLINVIGELFGAIHDESLLELGLGEE